MLLPIILQFFFYKTPFNIEHYSLYYLLPWVSLFFASMSHLIFIFLELWEQICFNIQLFVAQYLSFIELVYFWSQELSLNHFSHSVQLIISFSVIWVRSKVSGILTRINDESSEVHLVHCFFLWGLYLIFIFIELLGQLYFNIHKFFSTL